MRTVGVAFNVYVTGKVGAEGMGILTLVGSAYGFAVTFATSGIALAVTRLVAETVVTSPLDARRKRLANVALVSAVYALFFGGVAGAALFFGADFIGKSLLGDAKTVESLRIFAVTLPATALGSALSGYFSACRRVSKNAAAQIAAQAIKIAVTVSALTLLSPHGLEPTLAAVSIGGAVAEIGGAMMSYFLYVADKRANFPEKSAKMEQVGRTSRANGTELRSDTRRTAAACLISTALPLAVSSYVRSGLVTLEHILIPRGLKKSGASYSAALASYGVLHGMVMPVVLFPYAVLGSFSSLLVPELSICRANGEHARIRHISRQVFRATLIFAVGTATIMAAFSQELGLALYGSAEAGEYILMLAPVIPVMYLDTAADSMLKGLGRQNYCMRVNVADAAISVLLVWTLVPALGVKGYAATIIISELINAGFSVWKLLSVTGLKPELPRWVLRPLASATAAAAAVGCVLDVSSGAEVALAIIASTALYVAFLLVTGAVNAEDLGYMGGIFGREQNGSARKGARKNPAQKF